MSKAHHAKDNTDLVDVEGAPHVAPLPCLFLKGLGKALLGALFYTLRVCERPALFPVRTPHLRKYGNGIGNNL